MHIPANRPLAHRCAARPSAGGSWKGKGGRAFSAEICRASFSKKMHWFIGLPLSVLGIYTLVRIVPPIPYAHPPQGVKGKQKGRASSMRSLLHAGVLMADRSSGFSPIRCSGSQSAHAARCSAPCCRTAQWSGPWKPFGLPLPLRCCCAHSASPTRCRG